MNDNSVTTTPTIDAAKLTGITLARGSHSSTTRGCSVSAS